MTPRLSERPDPNQRTAGLPDGAYIAHCLAQSAKQLIALLGKRWPEIK